MNPIVKNLALKLCESAPAYVLEILFETLIKTWNDFIRKYNLPFRSIDISDVKAMTACSGVQTDHGQNFNDIDSSDPCREYSVNKGSDIGRFPIEQVDEQTFFDYFLEHAVQSRLFDRDLEEISLTTPSERCPQENVVPVSNFEGKVKAGGERNVDYRITKNSERKVGSEVLKGKEFKEEPQSSGDRMNLEVGTTALGILIPGDKEGKRGDHQGMCSTSVNLLTRGELCEERSRNIINKSETDATPRNDDITNTSESRLQTSNRPAYLKIKAESLQETEKDSNPEMVTSYFPEFCLKDSSKSPCPKADQYDDDLFEIEKVGIDSELDNAVKKLLDDISSEIQRNETNLKVSNLVSTGKRNEVIIQGETLPHGTECSGSTFGTTKGNLYTTHLPSENDFEDFIKARCRQDRMKGGDIDFEELREFDPISEKFALQTACTEFSVLDVKMLKNKIALAKTKIDYYNACQSKRVTRAKNETEKDDLKPLGKYHDNVLDDSHHLMAFGKKPFDDPITREEMKLAKDSLKNISVPVSKPKDSFITTEHINSENHKHEGFTKEELRDKEASVPPEGHKYCGAIDKITKGTLKTKQEIDYNNLPRSGYFENVNKSTFCKQQRSEFLKTPCDITLVKAIEEPVCNRILKRQACKGPRNNHKLEIYGMCPDCVESSADNKAYNKGCDSGRRTSNKDLQPRAHYKDRQSRVRSKSAEVARRQADFKKVTKKRSRKRVSFVDGHCVLSYNPEESILENARRNRRMMQEPPGSQLRSRSKSKCRGMKQANGNANNAERPSKKKVTFIEDRTVLVYDPEESILETFYRDSMVKKNVKRQTIKKERCRREAAVADRGNVRSHSRKEANKKEIKDGTGYVNFEDVPAFDRLPDLIHLTNLASVSGNSFDETEKLLPVEKTEVPERNSTLSRKMSEVSTNTEWNMKRWFRDSLLAHKRLSFKKMKSAILKK